MIPADIHLLLVVVIVLALSIVFACPICCSIVASSKGRSADRWFFAGILFGPFALIAIAGMPSLYPMLVELADDEE